MSAQTRIHRFNCVLIHYPDSSYINPWYEGATEVTNFGINDLHGSLMDRKLEKLTARGGKGSTGCYLLQIFEGDKPLENWLITGVEISKSCYLDMNTVHRSLFRSKLLGMELERGFDPLNEFLNFLNLVGRYITSNIDSLDFWDAYKSFSAYINDSPKNEYFNRESWQGDWINDLHQAIHELKDFRRNILHGPIQVLDPRWIYYVIGKFGFGLKEPAEFAQLMEIREGFCLAGGDIVAIQRAGGREFNDKFKFKHKLLNDVDPFLISSPCTKSSTKLSTFAC